MSESPQIEQQTPQPEKAQRILPDQPEDRLDPVNISDPVTWDQLDQEIAEAMAQDDGESPQQAEQPDTAQDELTDKIEQELGSESEPPETDELEPEARAEEDEPGEDDFDIYAQTVPVDLGGDEKRELTVGQLKDAAREYIQRAREFKDLSAKQESIEQMHVGLYKQRAELNRILNYVGNQIPEQVRAELKQHEESFLNEQRQRVLEFKPEWSDPERFEADRRVIHKFAGQFGIHAAEINNIPDSRFIALLARAAENDAMINRSIDEAKRVKAQPVKRARQAKKERDSIESAFKQAAELRGDERQWHVLDKVLGG